MNSITLKIIAVLGLALAVQGCETSAKIASAANPMNWFDDEETEEQKNAKVPGQDEDYPNIGAVPERPAEPEIKREYAELKSGLVSDKQNAKYTDQVIRSKAIPSDSLETPKAAKLPVKVTAPSNPPVASNVKPAPATITPEQGAPIRAAALPTQSSASPAPAPKPMKTEQSFTQANQPPANPGQLAAAPQPPAPVQPAQQSKAVDAGKLVANIYFPDGVKSLNDNDRAVVGQVLQILRAENASVRIIGHSSALANAGSPTANLTNYKVSLDRANAVASEFVRQGLPAQMIQVDARGASEPVYTEMTPAAQAYNRRVEIFVLR